MPAMQEHQVNDKITHVEVEPLLGNVDCVEAPSKPLSSQTYEVDAVDCDDEAPSKRSEIALTIVLLLLCILEVSYLIDYEWDKRAQQSPVGGSPAHSFLNGSREEDKSALNSLTEGGHTSTTSRQQWCSVSKGEHLIGRVSSVVSKYIFVFTSA
jgi:hypothetical protein